MRNRRRGSARKRRPDPDRRHPQARISRLRLDRARGDQRRPAAAGEHGACRRPRRAGERDANLRATPASRTRAGRRTARRPPTTRIRMSATARVAVVHNGIIENFEPLRERLQQQGYRFVTQTDTEVIAHLIHSHYDGDLLAAVRKAVARVPRRLRDRGDQHARAGPHRRRARGQPAARRRRRSRSFPCVRRDRARAGHPARRLPGRRRRRRRDAREATRSTMPTARPRRGRWSR